MDEDLDANGSDAKRHAHVDGDTAQSRHVHVVRRDAVCLEVAVDEEGERLLEVETAQVLVFPVERFEGEHVARFRVSLLRFHGKRVLPEL